MIICFENKIQCKHFVEIIESKSIYSFVTCKCGCSSVDGGHYHLSRSYFHSSEENFIDLSEVEDDGIE